MAQAAREYQYARRVWHRPADGGCYVVCRGLALPDTPGGPSGGNAVKVTDFMSAAVLRAAPGGAEMVSLYFEDSLVRRGGAGGGGQAGGVGRLRLAAPWGDGFLSC